MKENVSGFFSERMYSETRIDACVDERRELRVKLTRSQDRKEDRVR